MKLVVKEDKNLLKLKEEFSELFPYLRIEFYHGLKQNAIVLKSKANYEKCLSEFRLPSIKDGFTIKPTMTVCDLTENFRKIYGLSSMIMRKSGNAWLQTSLTENWTLEQQNSLGEELSR